MHWPLSKCICCTFPLAFESQGRERRFGDTTLKIRERGQRLFNAQPQTFSAQPASRCQRVAHISLSLSTLEEISRVDTRESGRSDSESIVRSAACSFADKERFQLNSGRTATVAALIRGRE